jgi:hypothetical protein
VITTPDGGPFDPRGSIEICLTPAELDGLRDADAGAPATHLGCPYVSRQTYPDFPAPWVLWSASLPTPKDDHCCYVARASCS